MYKIIAISTLSFLVLIFLVALPSSSYAATLKITPIGETPSTHFIISVENVEKLAGMKLQIQYPKDQLQFKEAKKEKTLNGFMHVINDKNPGKLILVMASAKGISGDKLALFELSFASSGKPQTEQLNITPITCELMSEMLVTIPCELKPATTKMQ